MQRARAIPGFAGALLLLVGSAAHSTLGWSAQRDALTGAHASPQLLQAMMIGWQFAGLAMFLLAVNALMLIRRASIGLPTSLAPLFVTGAGYVVFGAWALSISSLEPFFFIAFVLPGLLLLVAGRPSRRVPQPDR